MLSKQNAVIALALIRSALARLERQIAQDGGRWAEILGIHGEMSPSIHWRPIAQRERKESGSSRPDFTSTPSAQ